MLSVDEGSSTIYLSLGDRPVYLPVSTIEAPFAPMIPSLLLTVSLISSSIDKFLYI